MPTMPATLLSLLPRQMDPNTNTNMTNEDTINCYDDYCSSGAEIKYAVVGSIIALIIIWVFVGAIHARHRVRHGKQPLWYHRWFVSTRPQYNAYGGAPYGTPGYVPYGMQGNYARGREPGYEMWAPPPPAYNPADAPPTYQPPPDKAQMASSMGPAPDAAVQGTQASSSSAEARERQQAQGDVLDELQRPAAVHNPSQRTDRFA